MRILQNDFLQNLLDNSIKKVIITNIIYSSSLFTAITLNKKNINSYYIELLFSIYQTSLLDYEKPRLISYLIFYIINKKSHIHKE